jgi:hypothetical protein
MWVPVYYLKDAIHTSSFAQLRSIAATAYALTGALAAELSGQHLEKLNTTTLNYDNSTTTTTTNTTTTSIAATNSITATSTTTTTTTNYYNNYYYYQVKCLELSHLSYCHV